MFSRGFSKESDRKLFTGGLPRGFHLGLTMRHILDLTAFGRALDLVQARAVALCVGASLRAESALGTCSLHLI